MIVFMEESESPDALEHVDTPINLRPNLADYGIEEYDRGICADSFENLQILRKFKFSWKYLYTNDGHPSGQIEVLSEAMLTGRAEATLETRKNLLVDGRNPNSDYLTGRELLYANDADTMVPPWILAATRTYARIEDEREANPGKKIRAGLTAFPGRCTFIKSDGNRCMLWHSGRFEEEYCRVHNASIGNKNGSGAIERARQRVHQAAPYAVDTMTAMLSATSEPVRLRAAEQILDRAGVRGGIELDVSGSVEVRPAAELLAERLAKLRGATEKKQEFMASLESTDKDEASDMLVVDAEVVEDDDDTGRKA